MSWTPNRQLKNLGSVKSKNKILNINFQKLNLYKKIFSFLSFFLSFLASFIFYYFYLLLSVYPVAINESCLDNNFLAFPQPLKIYYWRINYVLNTVLDTTNMVRKRNTILAFVGLTIL